MSGNAFPTSVDVAVIGAGAAGVAAAKHLAAARPDLRLLLLEAGLRVGGRARTVERDGMALDLGCGWFHGARDNAWRRTAEDLGFAIDHALAPWDGDARSLGLGETRDAEAEQALQAFFARAEAREGEQPDVPMSAVLEPDGAWNGYVGAVGTFINGDSLARASLQDFNRYDPGRGPDSRAVAGYGRVVEAYAQGLPVALGTPVRSVDRRGRTIRIGTDRGTLEAQAVIVAVPTTVLTAETIRFDPPLPDKTTAAAALPLGLANKLFLRIPADVSLPEETHLFGSPVRERTCGYHVRPFGRPVIECYFGGDLARDMDGAVAAAAAFCVGELRPLLGATVADRLVPIVMSAWAADPFVGGAYSYAKPGASDLRSRLAEPVDDRLFFAGEACSRHRYSTAHGAFETGVGAAQAVAAALR